MGIPGTTRYFEALRRMRRAVVLSLSGILWGRRGKMVLECAIWAMLRFLGMLVWVGFFEYCPPGSCLLPSHPLALGLVHPVIFPYLKRNTYTFGWHVSAV